MDFQQEDGEAGALINPPSFSVAHSFLLMLSASFVSHSLPPDPWDHPPYFTFLPVLLVLDKTGFCLPWHHPFNFLERRAKKDEGLKVCGGKFLEDISGLCSQGTSCSQCEYGTLSMRSISMTIIFILQQSGSRQHSAKGGEKKLSSNSKHPL